MWHRKCKCLGQLLIIGGHKCLRIRISPEDKAAHAVAHKAGLKVAPKADHAVAAHPAVVQEVRAPELRAEARISIAKSENRAIRKIKF